MNDNTENKRKLDAILKAFEEHIDGQNYFDVVYSKKVGYLWIVIDHPGDAGAVLLDEPETLLDELFNDIIHDVINLPGNRDPRSDSPRLSIFEEAESRRRITAYLEKIEGDSREYLDYLDSYLEEYQERYDKEGE